MALDCGRERWFVPPCRSTKPMFAQVWLCCVVCHVVLLLLTHTPTYIRDCHARHLCVDTDPPTHPGGGGGVTTCPANTCWCVGRLLYTCKTSLSCMPSLLDTFVVFLELFEFCYWAGVGVVYSPTPKHCATLPFVAFLRNQITFPDIFGWGQHVGLKK